MEFSLPVASRPKVDLEAGRKYYIYGAGRLGRKISGILKTRGLQILGFIDRSAQGEVDGRPVFSPKAAAALKDQADGVLVAVFNHRFSIREIFAELRGAGWSHIYSAPDVALSLAPGELQLDYWLDLFEQPKPTDALLNDLDQAFHLFSDALSRRLFLELVDLRLTHDFHKVREAVENPDLDRQYFPADLPQRISATRMIDCGAFDGDSVKGALEYAQPMERLLCLEPDPSNFAKLVANIREKNLPLEVELSPLAVSNRTCILSFGSSSDMGSVILDADHARESKNTVHIQAVRMDDVYLNYNPSFIKMDIEGAELDALKGSTQIIQSSLPQLAICIYHKITHYSSIPLFLDSLECGYKFYLRAHGYNGQEIVLYALPPTAT